MQGSAGHFTVRSDNVKEICDRTIEILRNAGVRAYRRGATDQQFKAEGIKGNAFVGWLTNQVPFLSWFGWFSRLKVTVKCMRSLTEGDDSVHLYLRVVPIMEMRDSRENLLISQDVGEFVGDNMKAKRVYRQIVNDLHAAQVIDMKYG